MFTSGPFHKVLNTDSCRVRAKLPVFLLAGLVAAGLSGCAGVSGIPADPIGAQYGERCYIEDSQFAFADQLYDRMGSLQLVYKELCETYQWEACEINEAMYRLRKVHDLP
jgi:hypothetical protein